MSEQKTLFFSNIQIYTFYKRKKISPFGCASTLCENGNKELEKYIFSVSGQISNRMDGYRFAICLKE